MKAVLAAAGVPYRRTHDPQELCDLLTDSDVTLPTEVFELAGWSPFAVAFRYEDWLEPDPVDRARARGLTIAAISWAESEIAARP